MSNEDNCRNRSPPLERIIISSPSRQTISGLPLFLPYSGGRILAISGTPEKRITTLPCPSFIKIIPDDYWEDELKEAVMSRIKKYINYQFPGCEIGPRTSYWTRELVGMDPLYLIGPDLNPIEKKWAQAKSIRRKLRCTIEELFTEGLDYRSLI